MANILVMYDTPSLLVTSIENQLSELEHVAYHADLTVRSISKYKEKMDAYLIFADEDLSDNTEALVYIKDKSTEDDVPIFIAGDESEIKLFKKSVPASKIIREYNRPINVREVVETIDQFLKDENRISKKKVLVVDDSGAMLRNIKGWLEERYQIILANSGAMAIKYLSLERPDLILLDYEMPVLNGKQVLEMLRSELDFADIPVMFLTSKGDRESVLEVMALKPEGYLLKTQSPQEIIEAIDNFFAKKKIQEN